MSGCMDKDWRSKAKEDRTSSRSGRYDCAAQAGGTTALNEEG